MAQIRSTSWIAAALAATALALGASNGAGAAPSSVTVDVKDFAFRPGSVSVAAGTTVTWLNDDEEPHTVTSAEGVFKSEALESAGRFSYTFATPGTYHYFCALQPNMHADVVVR